MPNTHFLPFTGRYSVDPFLPLSENEIAGRLARGERDFRGANLAGADLTGLDLSGCDLTEADLGGCLIRNQRLVGARLSGANLSGARIFDSNLKQALMAGAILRGASGGGSDYGCNFLGADLRGADLSDSCWRGVTSFKGAALEGAQFGGALLVYSVLADAHIDRAYWSGAILARVLMHPDQMEFLRRQEDIRLTEPNLVERG